MSNQHSRKYQSRPLTQRPFALFLNSPEGRWFRSKVVRLAAAVASRKKKKRRKQ